MQIPIEGLSQSEPLKLDKLTSEDITNLLQKLQEDKHELEIQNKKLTQINSEMAETLNKYYDLYDYAPISYFTMNKNWIICESNVTGAKLLGIERGTLIGKPLSHFIVKKNHELFKQHCRNLFESGEQQICELKMINQVSGEFYARIESKVMLDDDGNFGRYRSVVSNITEEKSIEQALKESEEKYRLLVENSNETILVIKDESIKFCNSRAIELSGYPKEVLYNSNIFDFIYPEDLDVVVEKYNARLKGKIIEPYTFRIIDANNSIKYVEFNAILIDWDGEIATLNFLNDVTEKRKIDEERNSLAKRLQEQTEELSIINAELKKISKLKDEFLANMSHELRTPLSAILSISEALKENVYGDLNEKQHKSVQSIEESGSHLLDLINDILDVSKLEMGKLDLEITPVSIESVCESSLRIVKQSAQKKHLHVSSTYDSSITIIQADNRRLKQILVNLLSNAVKFTPDDGYIGLEVVGDSEQQLVHFTVWDTGIGISPDSIPLLFKPFTQINNPLSKKQQGSGLGLVVAHNLAKLHGGSISVESKVNKGSRFTVSLPWKEGYKEDVSCQEEEKNMLKNLEIMNNVESEAKLPLLLVVEDNEVTLETTFDYLSTRGYQIATAKSGIEALKQAKEIKPDLILMDIQIPEIDGFEVIRRIREDDSLAGIGIIALTALAMPGDRERCISAGANEYLGKPFSLRNLNRLIESQLRQTK